MIKSIKNVYKLKSELIYEQIICHEKWILSERSISIKRLSFEESNGNCFWEKKLLFARAEICDRNQHFANQRVRNQISFTRPLFNQLLYRKRVNEELNSHSREKVGAYRAKIARIKLFDPPVSSVGNVEKTWQKKCRRLAREIAIVVSK